MRRGWVAGARFALVFAGAYVLLRVSWPWLESTYSHIVHVEIVAAVAGMPEPIDVQWIDSESQQRLQGLEFDMRIVRHGRAVGRSANSSSVWPVRVSSRSVSFEPTAMLCALILATPVGVSRRARALILGPVILHALIVACLAAEVRYCLFSESWNDTMGLLEYVVVSLLSYVGAQSETHSVLPVLLWIALFLDIVVGRSALEGIGDRAAIPALSTRSAQSSGTRLRG